jgi:hypothetical protein
MAWRIELHLMAKTAQHDLLAVSGKLMPLARRPVGTGIRHRSLQGNAPSQRDTGRN